MPIQIDESREMDSASRRTFRKITQRFTYGAGAPNGTGKDGWQYYDTTNHRLYMSDGVGWIIMSEPQQSFTPNVVSSVGAIVAYTSTFTYQRSDGYLEHETSVAVTNNGTGAGFISLTVPVDSIEQIMGHGREILVTGFTLAMNRQAASTALIVTYANGYPAAANTNLQIHGRYRMITRYS